jgi:glycosyltransferase involved in cell wall biosynthesis
MSQKALKKRISIALVGRRMLESAAFVHCTATDEVRQSIKWFPRGRTVVVPCTMDLRVYRQLPEPELAREKFNLNRPGDMLLYISRIHPKKGLIHLIRALPRIREQYPAWLCVAGPREDAGYASLVDDEIRRLGLQESVKFVGNVSDPTLKTSLYSAARASVLPTSQENFGFVLFESLACGTPLVTTDLVDTWRELKEHGGAFIASQNPETVAREVLRVLSLSEAERFALSERARTWVLGYLDERAIGKQMEQAYEAACDQRI